MCVCVCVCVSLVHPSSGIWPSRELLELWDADSDYQWRSAKKSVPLFAVNVKDLNVESSVYRKPRSLLSPLSGFMAL